MANLPAEVVVAGVVGGGGRVSPVYLRRAPPWAKRPAQICKKPFTAENPTPLQAAVRVGLGLLAKDFANLSESEKASIREKTGLPGAAGYVLEMAEQGKGPDEKARDFFGTLPAPTGKRAIKRTYNTLPKLINIVKETIGKRAPVRGF